MATTAQRRANIRRAMEQARRQAIARREQAAETITGLFQRLAARVRAWLADNAGLDGYVPAARLAGFPAWLDALLAEHRRDWQAAFGGGVADVIGLAEILRPEGAAGRLADRTLQWLRDYTGADGLQLSDRLWRVDRATRAAISDTVQGAIVRGESARQAAMRMVAEGKAVPADVAVVLRDALGQRIGSAVQAAIEGNVMRNALRVTRTEINRAYTEAFVTSAFEYPDTAGVRFNLSPLHPRFDVCDIHAGANLHGLGPGVYPQGQHPYPAHPETLSYLTIVFLDEVTPADRAGRQSRTDWLKTQPADAQDSILGKNKGRVFREGRLLESELLDTWANVRARLGE